MALKHTSRNILDVIVPGSSYGPDAEIVKEIGLIFDEYFQNKISKEVFKIALLKSVKLYYQRDPMSREYGSRQSS